VKFGVLATSGISRISFLCSSEAVNVLDQVKH
jgi:hypothetical protein